MGKTAWMTSSLVALASAGALMSAPASAQPSISLQFGPPPPVRYEVVPPVRHGHVWVPGHWEWRGNGHVWVAGYYLRERPGYYYEQPVWVQDGGRWVYRSGNWHRGSHGHGFHGGRRDSDRDGIPNRYDRDRDNDGIRNRHDRDRDGDGVPNRYDRAPDNRYRR